MPIHNPTGPIAPSSPGGVLIDPAGAELVPSTALDNVWKGDGAGGWVQGASPGGGSQTLAQTLALGADANGIGVTGLDFIEGVDSLWKIRTVSIVLSALSGPTATAVGLIPAGSLVMGVVARVTTPITGATSFDIGDGSDVDRWGAAITTTTTSPTDFTDNTLSWTTSAGDVVFTANGGNFTAGAVRLVVTLMSLTAPTS